MKRITKLFSNIIRSYSPRPGTYSPCVITCALTGNVPTKEMNPNLPITTEQIANDAISVYKAGASVVHIHARDENQLPSQDLNLYRDIVLRIKEEAPDLIVQLTTGGRSGTSDDLRCDVIRLCPEMGSFTTGSNNLAKICYINDPDFLIKLATVFKKTGVKPEIECFDSGHLDNALFLAKKGLLDMPLHFNFVLGAVGAASGTVKNLQHMVDMVPEGCTWSGTGLAYAQFDLAAASLAMGGNVRVGMEDQILMPDGKLGSNVEMVEKVVRIADEMGREIADPKIARELLSLDESRRDLILDYCEMDGPIFEMDY